MMQTPLAELGAHTWPALQPCVVAADARAHALAAPVHVAGGSVVPDWVGEPQLPPVTVAVALTKSAP